jgi:outer membrane protein TolC
MRAALKFMVVVQLGLLSGCTVGPTYHPPASKALPQWSPALAGGETTNSGSVAFWWKNFNDPELNSLIERAVTSNLDLKIATARVREARAQYRVTAADLWPTVGTSASYERQLQSMNQPLLGAIPLPGKRPI